MAAILGGGTHVTVQGGELPVRALVLHQANRYRVCFTRKTSHRRCMLAPAAKSAGAASLFIDSIHGGLYETGIYCALS
jgi:hypothetical protein